MKTARWVTEIKPSFIREILKVTSQPGVISFAGGLPAPELFPVTELGQAFAAALSQQGAQMLQYSPSEGDLFLRETLTNHLESRGTPAAPDQILLTNGSQHGLDLIAKALIDPGDVVLVEDPTYLGALQAFGPYAPRIKAVSSDAEGMLPSALAEALAAHHPKLVYVMPTFQNPRGTSMSTQRRAAIAAACKAADVALVEDDPYGELRYRGDHLPGLRHHWDRAVYLGTFSKTLAPGLRLGWMVAPPELLPALKLGVQATCLHVGTLTQRVAAMMLASPNYPGHLERLRQVYGERMHCMLEQLDHHFPPGTTWTLPEGGLFLWVNLPDGIKSVELFDVAIAQGVAFVPGHPFYVGPGGDSGLRLNFSNSTTDQIRQGMAKLGQALASLAKV